MKILHRDNEVIVCVKERGLLSQWAENKPNMIDEIKKSIGGEVYPVHRLDKDVGGVMVFALTQKAAAQLSSQMAERTAEKIYLAVVHGRPEAESGAFEDLLFFDKGRNKAFVVKKERRGVKKAALEYKVCESRQEKSLVRVRLLTGRTHQIRVQFASRKMPLYGDRRYGGRDDEKTVALWSYRIAFLHPTDKQTMSFELLPKEDEAFREFYRDEK